MKNNTLENNKINYATTNSHYLNADFDKIGKDNYMIKLNGIVYDIFIDIFDPKSTSIYNKDIYIQTYNEYGHHQFVLQDISGLSPKSKQPNEFEYISYTFYDENLFTDILAKIIKTNFGIKVGYSLSSKLSENYDVNNNINLIYDNKQYIMNVIDDENSNVIKVFNSNGDLIYNHAYNKNNNFKYLLYDENYSEDFKFMIENVQFFYKRR